VFYAKQPAPQPELWISTEQLVKPAPSSFYTKLDQTLESLGFADQVRALCAPAYDQSGVGRPGIDPVVYLKMMMIGFFENLPGERAIAARCADSFSIRAFLHYELTEATPDHTSLTIIRQRLPGPVYDAIFTLVLSALQQQGLLRGKNLGIDSSVIEANASLRGLVHRNTGEQYWEYVKRLAGESGVDPHDASAVRQFDRQRPKKMSNQEWENPADPDAKIGPKKDGATDMVYKPETVVDLDTGAITGAQVLPGDQADTREASTRLLESQQTINQARGEATDLLTVATVTADKGYFEIGQLKALQSEGLKTVICDPVTGRRMDRLEGADLAAVKAARRSAKSQYGQQLLRRRGMHLERAFAHILDGGGMRRTTLRGLENLNKRFKLAAAFYNLSQLMRKLIGYGTPKQYEALRAGGLGGVIGLMVRWWRVILATTFQTGWQRECSSQEIESTVFFCGIPSDRSWVKNWGISTGC
jgi:transposase